MSAMEQSLRRALEAGNAADPAFRDSIYTASERALERMLAAKGTDADAAHAQRVRLAETINRIEEDYFTSEGGAEGAASGEWPVSTPDGSGDAVAAPLADHAPDDPGFNREDGSRLADAPAERDEAERAGPAPADAGAAAAQLPPPPATAGPADAASWSPGAARRTAEARSLAKGVSRPFLFGLVALLIVLLGGIYIFYATIFGPMADSPPADEVGAILQGAAAETAAAEEADWIKIFDGTQLELISTPTGGEVLAMTGAGDRQAVRLSAAGEGGEVGVALGPGVINRIKGRKVRVEITAGTRDGTPREFGVRCLFGGDTVCGRQRFTAVQASEAFVFDLTVPDSPSASGTIALDPGMGAANDLDLYSVRLRIVDAA